MKVCRQQDKQPALTLGDLKKGETFVFEFEGDTERLAMKLCGGNFIYLEDPRKGDDGEVGYVYYTGPTHVSRRSVRRVNACLTIEE